MIYAHLWPDFRVITIEILLCIIILRSAILNELDLKVMKLDVKLKTELYTGAQNLFLAVAPASVLGVFTKCYYVKVISRHLQKVIIFINPLDFYLPVVLWIPQYSREHQIQMSIKTTFWRSSNDGWSRWRTSRLSWDHCSLLLAQDNF